MPEFPSTTIAEIHQMVGAGIRVIVDNFLGVVIMWNWSFFNSGAVLVGGLLVRSFSFFAFGLRPGRRSDIIHTIFGACRDQSSVIFRPFG